MRMLFKLMVIRKVFVSYLVLWHFACSDVIRPNTIHQDKKLITFHLHLNSSDQYGHLDFEEIGHSVNLLFDSLQIDFCIRLDTAIYIKDQKVQYISRLNKSVESSFHFIQFYDNRNSDVLAFTDYNEHIIQINDYEGFSPTILLHEFFHLASRANHVKTHSDGYYIPSQNPYKVKVPYGCLNLMTDDNLYPFSFLISEEQRDQFSQTSNHLELNGKKEMVHSLPKSLISSNYENLLKCNSWKDFRFHDSVLQKYIDHFLVRFDQEKMQSYKIPTRSHSNQKYSSNSRNVSHLSEYELNKIYIILHLRQQYWEEIEFIYPQSSLMRKIQYFRNRINQAITSLQISQSLKDQLFQSLPNFCLQHIKLPQASQNTPL